MSNDLIGKKLVYADDISRYIKTEINPYGKPFEGSAYEFGLKIMEYINNMSAAMTAEEAWEIAKKIACNEERGGLSSAEFIDIFGKCCFEDALSNYTPQQAKAKIEAWEAEQEIKVGDGNMQRAIDYFENEIRIMKRYNISLDCVEIAETAISAMRELQQYRERIEQLKRTEVRLFECKLPDGRICRFSDFIEFLEKG